MNIDQGVLVLFASGIVSLGVLAFGVFTTYRKQLLKFMDDMSDSTTMSSRTFVKAE